MRTLVRQWTTTTFSPISRIPIPVNTEFPLNYQIHLPNIHNSSSALFSPTPTAPRLSMAASPQSTAQTVSDDDSDVFQLIQSHEEKAARLPPVEEIRTLLDRSVDFGDFQFLRIEPKVVRYVSGVATALLGSGEFSNEEYKAAKVDPIAQFSKPVATHMNKDHADDTKVIVQHSTSIPVDFAYMLDLDSLGFNVKAGYQGNTFKLRIPFPRRAEDRKDVKTLIVEMLQAARPQVN
ncbi:FMN-binding split barrel [Parasponia andersonii]|uniref:FMN-binding split barrel n=1 Tax=Parasponia andersonii TaxID=3476 RepID=A0A2P5ATX0_PARAD|nr:FMN-binding split barrel [Parasponia andersonii]